MTQQDDQVSFQFDNDAKPAGEGFEPIPEGVYRTVCEKIEVGTTQNHDKKWTAFLRIVEGPHTGRYLFENVTFNQRGQNFVFSFFQAFGFNAQPGQAITARTSDLIGRYVMAKVYGHRTAPNGKTYEETLLMPDSGPTSQQSNPPRADQQQMNFAPPPQQPQQGFGQGTGIPINPPPAQQPQQQPQQPPAQQQGTVGGIQNPPF